MKGELQWDIRLTSALRLTASSYARGYTKGSFFRYCADRGGCWAPLGAVFYIFYKHESILPNWLETGDWDSDSKWTKKGRRKDSFVNE